MTKIRLLRELDQADGRDAHDIAESLKLSYPAAAMRLLRLVRQGLAVRYRDSDDDLYWYELTEHGEDRLNYLENADGDCQYEE